MAETRYTPTVVGAGQPKSGKLMLVIGLLAVAALIVANIDSGGSQSAQERRQPAATSKAARHKAAREQAEFSRLQAEMDKLDDSPCGTRLFFEKLLGTWYVGCPECARVPADRLYPEYFMDAVERFAVNGEITVTRLLRYRGECP